MFVLCVCLVVCVNVVNTVCKLEMVHVHAYECIAIDLTPTQNCMNTLNVKTTFL